MSLGPPVMRRIPTLRNRTTKIPREPYVCDPPLICGRLTTSANGAPFASPAGDSWYRDHPARGGARAVYLEHFPAHASHVFGARGTPATARFRTSSALWHPAAWMCGRSHEPVSGGPGRRVGGEGEQTAGRQGHDQEDGVHACSSTQGCMDPRRIEAMVVHERECRTTRASLRKLRSGPRAADPMSCTRMGRALAAPPAWLPTEDSSAADMVSRSRGPAPICKVG